MLSFFPRGVLDEILNLIESVSEGFPSYSQKLDTVTCLKYLGAVLSQKGSKSEVLSGIVQATVALTKPKLIRRDRNIPLRSKVKLIYSPVISIFLYACESTGTFTTELEKRKQAFEMRCYRMTVLYNSVLRLRRFAERFKQPLYLI